MDGRRYLERFIATQIRAEAEAQIPESPTVTLVAHICGVATGLHATGAISRADMMEVLRDLERTLLDAARIRRVRLAQREA